MAPKLTIDPKRCDTCGTCVTICPHDALSIVAELAVDDVRCIRCAKCIPVCPVGALSMDRAGEGE